MLRPPAAAPHFAVDGDAVRRFLNGFHDGLCAALERLDGRARFAGDAWERDAGGGVTRALTDGALFEKAGVGFSHVFGTALLPSATAARPQLAERG